MKKYIGTFIGVILSILLLLVYTIPWKAVGINLPDLGNYRLGLDLQGGIELDYSIFLDDARKMEDYSPEKERNIIEGLKKIIDTRISELKINDSIINHADYNGEKHIIVQIPLKGNSEIENSDNIALAKAAIGRVVKLEFKERRTAMPTANELKEREDLAKEILENVSNPNLIFLVEGQKYKDNFERIEIGSFKGNFEDLKELFELSPENKKVGILNSPISGNLEMIDENIPASEINSVNSQNILLDQKYGYNSESGNFVVKINNIGENEIDLNYIFIAKNPSIWKTAFDQNGNTITPENFSNASTSIAPTGTPQIDLIFTQGGGQVFGNLTQRLQGREMAIFVGGQMLTNPNVNTAIWGGTAQISGNYTVASARQLANDINTGIIPAPIYLTSEKTIDSRLGENSIKELFLAGSVGFLIIFAFLIYIYRWAGVMAGISLFLYALLLLGVSKIFGIVLTVASIAGIILSIGMSIDANILIFERIKDVLKEKMDQKKSIDVGFKEAFSAIFDANLTSFIIAAILFIFGINMIKGFGIMLGIGIILSFLTAVFISRFLIKYLGEYNLDNKKFIGLKE